MGRNTMDYLQPYQSALCKACDMTTTEFLHFLDQDRPIMQQGLFPEVQANYTLNCTLNIEEVILKGKLFIFTYLVCAEILQPNTAEELRS